MVAVDFKKSIPLHKLPFCLKCLFVVLHDGEDVELPKLLTVAQIDIIRSLFIVMFQSSKVIVLRMTEFIPAFSIPLVHIAKDDKAVVAHVEVVECTFLRFGILGDVLIYLRQSLEDKFPLR
jgi:hypothetical protein